MSKTVIAQRNIGSPSDAQRIFNSASAKVVPVVLAPASRSICSCYYTVPAGVACITQRFGVDCDTDLNGVMQLTDPGLKCAPAFQQVKYCVTKEPCTYEAPVKSCPTADNVLVDCVLALVFQIGPEPNKVRDFVYKLGAPRFNDFLSAAVDAAMRQLVRGEMLVNVLELLGYRQAALRRVLESLNSKFESFGIRFLRIVIKEVSIGRMFEKMREQETNFRIKIRDIEKEHEVVMKKVNYDYEQRRAVLERDYGRVLQDIENDMNVALIDRKKLKIAAESNTKADEDRSWDISLQ